MKKVILFLLTIHLILPLFVYTIKDVSKVHVMKFTGSFNIIYQDIKKYSDDLTFIQSVIFDTPTSLETTLFLTKLQTFNTNLYYSNISYLIHSPRAPPFVL